MLLLLLQLIDFEIYFEYGSFAHPFLLFTGCCWMATL